MAMEVSDLVVILGAVKKEDMQSEGAAPQGLPSHQEPLNEVLIDVIRCL